jgi:hypothetical protein
MPRASTSTRRRGRPSKLHTVVAVRTEEGKPDVLVRAGEALIERLRAGAYREEAARSVGIAKQTFYNWLYQGAHARHGALRGERLTHEQRDYAEFLDAVEEAEATALLTDWTRLGTLAAGGLPQVTVTEKVDPEGRLIERTVRTSHTLPSENALMWRLERRWPKLFGRRTAVELTGTEGGPIEFDVDDVRARARALADEIRAYQQGIADGSIAAPGEG